MYINFWYAIALSSSLKADKPLKLRRLSQNLVLYRDEAGLAHCLHDVCSHRGGSLAAGRILEGNIECPYHGWQFNAEGQCVHIPFFSGQSQRIPQRSRMDSYPVQEKYGLVFAFLGDLLEQRRPPLLAPDSNPAHYQYPEDQWRWVTMSWPVKANYERCVENAIDPSHNQYVHRAHGFMGNRQETFQMNRVDAIEHEWGNGYCHQFYTSKEAVAGGEGDLSVSAGHSGPGQVWNYTHITRENWMHQYLYMTPVDDFNTVVFNISISNFLPVDVASDKEIMAMSEAIAMEDVQIVEGITPIITPEDMSGEVMLVSDKAIMVYRSFISNWKERGWRIDSASLNRESANKVFAIPSPGRRCQDGWVFEAVPLCVATSANAKKFG